jgi:hypothetical protein
MANLEDAKDNIADIIKRLGSVRHTSSLVAQWSLDNLEYCQNRIQRIINDVEEIISIESGNGAMGGREERAS